MCPKPTSIAQGWPAAFAVDATDVYWMQSEPSQLVRTPKTGGGNTLLATDVDAFTLAIILAVPTGGGAAVDTCAGGSMGIVGIAADDTMIYWGLVFEGYGQILRKPR